MTPHVQPWWQTLALWIGSLLSVAGFVLAFRVLHKGDIDIEEEDDEES